MKKIYLLLALAMPFLGQAQSTFSGNAQFADQMAIDTFSNQYTTITGKLQVFGNDITDLSPLANIDSVLGKFEILNTDSLANFDGLNIKYVGSNVYLDNNKALLNIDGLSQLDYIGRDLVIINNDTLQHLDGLANVDTIARHIYIGEEGWQTPPVAAGNRNLSDLCGISNAYFSNSYFVANNLYNPTQTQLTLGDCFAELTINGNLQLGSQADINAIRQQVTKVTGKLQVFGTDVMDLSPLGGIDTVLGKFEILLTDSLTNFDGLNIKYVGSNVYIADNKALLNIDGLSQLDYVGRDLVFLRNDTLQHLDGLSNLDTIARHIYIGEEGWQTPPVAAGNPYLSDLCGMSTAYFSRDYFVAHNLHNPTQNQLTSDSCFAELTVNGNLQLGSQADIDAVREQYTKVTGKLQVFGSDVKDLSPLANIDTVLGKFEILLTDSLKTLSGVNVRYIGSNVYIADNRFLGDIDGLDSVTYIGRDFVILRNDSLKNLDGISNVDTIARHIYIGEEGWKTPSVAAANPVLDDLCGLSNAYNGGGFNNDYFVANNAYNPTKADLGNGNCSINISLDEIDSKISNVYLFDNQLTIETTETLENTSIEVYNMLGAQLENRYIGNIANRTTVRLSLKSNQIYIVVIRSNNTQSVFKVLNR